MRQADDKVLLRAPSGIKLFIISVKRFFDTRHTIVKRPARSKGQIGKNIDWRTFCAGNRNLMVDRRKADAFAAVLRRVNGCLNRINQFFRRRRVIAVRYNELNRAARLKPYD